MSHTCASLAPPPVRYKSLSLPYLLHKLVVSLAVWCSFSSSICIPPRISVTWSSSVKVWPHMSKSIFSVFSDFYFNCLPPFHVTREHSWTFSRTKLTLKSWLRPTPTERLMHARIDEAFFLIRPSRGVWMRFCGNLLGCPRARLPGSWLPFYI